MTRDQLRLKILKENPGMKQSDDLFREALVLGALTLYGFNHARLANFTGMSKGEVRFLLARMENKLRAEARAIEEARRKEIENYDPTQERNSGNADGAGSGDIPPTAQANVTEPVLASDLPAES